MIKRHLITICFLLMVMVTSLLAQESEGETKVEAPRLGVEYIIKIARKYAARQGRNIEEYYIQAVEYNTLKEIWYILFERRWIPFPGSCFAVAVTDETEKLGLLPCK